jgi:hypothetical protein
MACPKCGCKVHYQYTGGGDDFDRWVDQLERAIHSYAAWLAEFTTGDLQSLNVMRLRDESDTARRKLQAALTAALGVASSSQASAQTSNGDTK